MCALGTWCSSTCRWSGRRWAIAQLHLDGFGGKVEYAQLLHDASEVRFTEPSVHELEAMSDEMKARKTLTLNLPVIKPNVAIPVIELFMK